MKNIEYDSSRPIMRLEKGDKAVIKITHATFENAKDKEEYKDVPNGIYDAICVEPYKLVCVEYPVLSGYYNYWRGDKRACSGLIYANEKDN